MTKKELEKEAEEWAKDHHYYNGTTKGYVAERDSVINAYLACAEPREKQTQIDAEQIRALQKQNGELTDKIRELEAQLEREKNLNQCMSDNNEQLREQIEKMKSDVMGNIKWADQNKNNQMYYKLNAMINQWEIKEK